MSVSETGIVVAHFVGGPWNCEYQLMDAPLKKAFTPLLNTGRYILMGKNKYVYEVKKKISPQLQFGFMSCQTGR